VVEIHRDRLRGDYSACTADTWWRPVSIKGSLTTATFPIGSTGGHTSENIGYDANDNVVSRLTRALATISFAYDMLNRLCTKTIATTATACTATSSASPTVWYRYDLNGRTTSMIDNSAAITAAVPPAPGTPVSYTTTTRACLQLSRIIAETS
jgi:YD repeat-containing protein